MILNQNYNATGCFVKALHMMYQSNKCIENQATMYNDV